MPATQAHRFLSIKTALGADTLLVKDFSMSEQLGRLFQMEVALRSEDRALKFDDVVGTNATVELDLPNGKKRHFNGFVSRFMQVEHEQSYALYRATIVPWLWFLTRASDCRIFQKKKVPDIIEEVFKGHGFKDYKLKLSETYREWDYCVQYRETDFNFVSRLMEQEGIYYFFDHEDGKHTLMLTDAPSAHEPFPDYAEMVYRPPTSQKEESTETVTDWVIEKQVQPGQYVLADFNFKTPKAAIRVNSNISRQHEASDYEVFDYPGVFGQRGEGEHYAKVRIQEMHVPHETLRAQATVRGVSTGHKFTLKSHPRSDQNREYLITGASFHITSGEYETGSKGNEREFYSCSFTAIPASQPFRSARITPKPVIQGIQTATVVGPSGETIHTNEFGQIKAQFHWDRHAKGDDSASCWIRVSQPWGGKNWGGMFIPHVGQEVVVAFEEGDPDRPLITGRVYNPDQMPPLGLPANKTKSAIRDHGGNEIIMEGAAGKQQIRLFSPTANTKISMGAPNSPDELSIHTDGNCGVTVDKNHKVATKGDKEEKTEGKESKTTVGPFKFEKKNTWRDVTYGKTHDTFLGAKSDLTVGTLIETRIVNHTEIKGGTHFELKKAWHVELDKVGRKEKGSKLQELIEEHEHYTKKQSEKLNERIVKAAKVSEQIEEWRTKYEKGEIDAKKYDMKVKKLDQKHDKVNAQVDEATMNWKNGQVICDILKLG